MAIISNLDIINQMKTIAASPVKKAASLILCRSSKSLNSFFDYQILMLERKDTLKSFSSVLAFPGGKFDQQKDEQMVSAMQIQNCSIATALRECFQQTGIYLTEKPLLETSLISDLNQIKMQYIASQFYKSSKIVTKQATIESNKESQSQMYKIYKRISSITRPKKSLLPFIRLITVPLIKNRYDAYFYVHRIQDFKHINFMKFAQNQKYLHSLDHIVMNQQFSSFNWYTPLQALQGFVEKKIKLAPPQFIMLNIMANFHKYEEFQDYIGKCSTNWINMGPNIVSMIKNSGTLKQTYPYAATLIGDAQFPYQHSINTEKNGGLIKQIEESHKKLQNELEKRKNRLLFKKPLQFFEDEYSNECTIQDSVMSKFMDSNKLKKQLQLYQ